MRKSRKWGLAETPSAQFQLKQGQSNYAYPTYPRQFYKSAVRTRAASTNRSEDIADFPQKSRFLGVSRRCFSRLSPHPGQSGKSYLLSILIIYRYIHACQVSGKSYGNFLRYRLKWNKTVYIWTGTGRRLGVGPYPLLDCQNLSKRDGHLEAERVWLLVFGNILDERRAAPPAYGRRAWSKVVLYLRVFRYVLQFWSEFRRRLNNKTVPNHKKLVKTMLGQWRNSFFGFETSSVSALCVVRKLFFG